MERIKGKEKRDQASRAVEGRPRYLLKGEDQVFQLELYFVGGGKRNLGPLGGVRD